ncbi:hypothetical protein [Shimia biformata]|uniref:hypothetical protein n=1 Tax=Shimia biformata TaxID=1294299 RepID=UPI0019517935|nr:hypothetical protein [Shimia biformata]
MLRFALISCVLLSGTTAPVSAGDWRVLDDAGIAGSLAGKTVEYSGASQSFYVSGRTLYDSGRPSWGYWETRAGRYCSQWPPADGWACYGVEADGKGHVRFIGESGHVTEGRIVGTAD